MHTKYTKLVLFIAGMAALTSCSTAYKMGQTPDDVYYSPAKPQSEYASNDRDRNDDDGYYTTGNSRNNKYNANQYNDPYYSGYDMYRNDRFLRMSIGNRSRWGGYNDYLAYDGIYNYNRFNIYNDFYYDSPFNSYFYWNSFYNPYTPYGYGIGYNPYYGGGGIVIPGGGGKYPTTSILPSARPRPFNAAGYTNNSYTNNNRYLNPNSYSNPVNNNTGRANNSSRYNSANNRNANSYYNNSNNRSISPFRNTSPNNNNSMFNNNNSSPARSYNPVSSGSSMGGGGSSSGGGGGVSRPTRGGN